MATMVTTPTDGDHSVLGGLSGFLDLILKWFEVRPAPSEVPADWAPALEQGGRFLSSFLDAAHLADLDRSIDRFVDSKELADVASTIAPHQVLDMNEGDLPIRGEPASKGLIEALGEGTAAQFMRLLPLVATYVRAVQGHAEVVGKERFEAELEAAQVQPIRVFDPRLTTTERSLIWKQSRGNVTVLAILSAALHGVSKDQSWILRHLVATAHESLEAALILLANDPDMAARIPEEILPRSRRLPSGLLRQEREKEARIKRQVLDAVNMPPGKILGE